MNSRCISCGSNTSILWSLLYSSSPSSSSSEPQMGLRKSFLGGSDRSPKNDRTLSIKAELVIANNTGGFQFGFQHGLWILDGLAGWSLIVFTVWLFLQLRNNKNNFRHSTFVKFHSFDSWQLTLTKCQNCLSRLDMILRSETIMHKKFGKYCMYLLINYYTYK